MSTAADLEFRFLHRPLSSSGGTPTLFTASGGTATSVVSAGLVEASGYWDEAVLRWDSGPNAGRWSQVLEFVAAQQRLVLDDPLPHAAAAGHTFTLFLGGGHASSARVPGLRTSPLVHLTGLEVDFAAPMNGEGTGVLRFNVGSSQVFWTPPGGTEGAGVDVSGLAFGDRVAVLAGGDTLEARAKFLLLERTVATLPAADVLDDLSLDVVQGVLLARVAGEAAASGVTFYRPVAVRNVAGDAAHALVAYLASPLPGAAATTLAADLGTGAGTLEADSLYGWGASGWVRNVTKGDVRYFFDRSGNRARVASPGAGMRGCTAVAWDDGDQLVLLPWCDIGLDAPGAGSVFEDPATRETAPSGVAFSCPLSASAGLVIGDLAAGGVHCIWLRFEIPAGARPLEGGRVDLRVHAQVSEQE